MATYYVVADGSTPLGANQIEAGSTIDVHDGDVFIFEADADKTTKFELASGEPYSSDFSIIFTDTNTSGSNFTVEVKADLNVDFSVADGADVSNISIDASYSDSTSLTVGDGASINAYSGSSSGADMLEFGDNIAIMGKIDTQGGSDSITIGNDGHFYDEIKLGSGNDEIMIGSGNTFDKKITTDGGGDTFTSADNNTFNNTIDTGDGEDTVTFGDDNTITDFWAGNEADIVDVGFVDSSVAQTIDGVAHQPGAVDDVLRIDVSDDRAGFEQALNDNGYIQQPDGTWLADGSTDFHLMWNNVEINDFEKIIICFVRGTLIETPNGPVQIEDLRAGDLGHRLICSQPDA
ncbi:MAG: Hint domain-containing protein [Rhodobacteraceae bacterium]|nr:Hint domain-containing protein [Paracoccaceae bacterium]